MNKVALIFGGPSAEHDVSLVSAKNILQALKEAQLDFVLIAITKNKAWRAISEKELESTSFEHPIDVSSLGLEVKPIKNQGHIFLESLQDKENIGVIDVAFPICHGPFGEDGQLQEQLDKIDLTYVGSDQKSCKTAFDKALTKKVIENTNIQQLPYLVMEENLIPFTEVTKKLRLPVFVKPANMGSSVGIHKVKNENDYKKAILDAKNYDSKIVIEQGIKAREIECAILQKETLIEASAIGEIKPNHEFYSYEAKYLDPSGADLLIPATLGAETATKIQNLSIQAFKHLNCRDFARVDFFLTPKNEIYFNEINTHPGFTNISQFPMLWKESGIEYKDLILTLINNARERNQ